ncbi:hypothetical protein EDEG_01143 [Edhazardia aedis USNM 41457]|uniref:Uncharacterized protein n=1 Tax=Edhazardia aedis (strain USNM 41457) TaxID=1003232 RepID=J9DTP4_EDHAE|nr:hypothetical protein EDEG_01143 [Edhazardia aedis USNM 41457]|eukprot:EJW04652.1 hypothetical protein EDEG_01143 [Edhazardia aedis USNM 41457]
MSRIPLQKIDVNIAKPPAKPAAPPQQNYSKENILNLRESIDEHDISSYQPYFADTMSHFFLTESFYLENVANIPLIQNDVTFHMRCLLIDWLIEVHYKLMFVQETLYLTINIIDRFLGSYEVPKNKLQLLGVTSLFVACKYEEVAPPNIETFISLCDTDCKELWLVERYVLQKLDYTLDMPSPLNFIRVLSKADNYNEEVRLMAKYLLEITFFDLKLNAVRFSLRAVTSMYISRIILDVNQCEDLFWEYSGFEKPDIEECLELMLALLQRGVGYDFIRKKYSSSKFGRVAKIVDSYLASIN